MKVAYVLEAPGTQINRGGLIFEVLRWYIYMDPAYSNMLKEAVLSQ